MEEEINQEEETNEVRRPRPLQQLPTKNQSDDDDGPDADAALERITVTPSPHHSSPTQDGTGSITSSRRPNNNDGFSHNNGEEEEASANTSSFSSSSSLVMEQTGVSQTAHTPHMSSLSSSSSKLPTDSFAFVPIAAAAATDATLPVPPPTTTATTTATTTMTLLPATASVAETMEPGKKRKIEQSEVVNDDAESMAHQERLEDCNSSGNNNNKRQKKKTMEWDDYYALLPGFLAEHAHLRISKNFTTTNGIKLGIWAQNQRCAYLRKIRIETEGAAVDNNKPRHHHQKILSQHHMDQLNKLGFCWKLVDSPRNPARKWEEYYALLPAFKIEHGHLRIPSSFTTANGISLGVWAQNQRAAYSYKQRNSKAANNYNISQTRIDLLNKVGFAWRLADEQQPRPPPVVVDAAPMAAAAASIQQPEELTVDTMQLAGKKRKSDQSSAVLVNDDAEPSAVSHHANLKDCNSSRGKNSNNNKKRQKCQRSKQMRWEDYYALLPTFKIEHGHLRIPSRYKTANGVKVGVWAQNQRCAYSRIQRNSTIASNYNISQDRIDLLNKIGFAWRLADEQPRPPVVDASVAAASIQQQELDTMKPGKKRKSDQSAELVNDDAESVVSHHENLKDSNSSRGNDNSNNNKRQKRQSKGMKWEDYYALLPAFKMEHGHLRIPYSFTTANGISLGVWGQNQRRAYSHKQRNSKTVNKYNINQTRIDLLNKVGFAWSLLKGKPVALQHCKSSQSLVCGDNDDDTQEQNKSMSSSSLSKECSAHMSVIELDNANAQQQSFTPLAASPSLGMWKMSSQPASSLSPPSSLLTLSGTTAAAWPCSQGQQPGVADCNNDNNNNNNTPSWDDYYYQLVFFKATRDHTNVPSDYVCKAGLELGKWVIRQRALLSASLQEAESKNKPLPQDIAVRIGMLKEIGFDFDAESGTTQQSNSDRQQATNGEETPRQHGASSFAAAPAVDTCSSPTEAGVSKDEGCNLNNPVDMKDGSTRQHETGGESLTESHLSAEKNEEDSAPIDFSSTTISTAHQTGPAMSTGQKQTTTRQSSSSSSWQPIILQALPHPGAPGMQQHNEEQLTVMAEHEMAMPLRISNHGAGHEMMPQQSAARHQWHHQQQSMMMMHQLAPPPSQEEEQLFADYEAPAAGAGAPSDNTSIINHSNNNNNDDEILVDFSFDSCSNNILVDVSFSSQTMSI